MTEGAKSDFDKLIGPTEFEQRARDFIKKVEGTIDMHNPCIKVEIDNSADKVPSLDNLLKEVSKGSDRFRRIIEAPLRKKAAKMDKLSAFLVDVTIEISGDLSIPANEGKTIEQMSEDLKRLADEITEISKPYKPVFRAVSSTREPFDIFDSKEENEKMRKELESEPTLLLHFRFEPIPDNPLPKPEAPSLN